MTAHRPARAAATAYRVTGWPDQVTPMRLAVEPEYGLEGYRHILAGELAALSRAIEHHGIGTDGARFLRPPPPPPSVATLPDAVPPRTAGQPPRYQERRPEARVSALLNARALPRWRVTLRLTLGRLRHRVRQAWLAARHSPLREGCDLGLLQSLVAEAPHMVCFSARWRAVFEQTVTAWRGGCDWLQWDDEPERVEGVVRVPLTRLHPRRFPGWSRYVAPTLPAGTLLVLDGDQLAAARAGLRHALEAATSVLVADECVDATGWANCRRLGRRLWLLQGPPPELTRVPHDAPSGGWPKISLVTVSFNQAAYIKACLDSVLEQGYPNLEYIVVDGGSTDGTQDILEQYRDRLTHLIIEPDDGQSDALNKGMALATGDIVNWLCSDDMLEPGSLFHVGRAFAANDVDMVAGGCRLIDAAGRPYYAHHTGLPLGEVSDLSLGDLLGFLAVWQTGMFFFQPDVFFSRRLWLDSGGYIKRHLHFAMDYDLYLRFAMAGARVLHIPHYIGCSRTHAAQKTRHDDMMYLPTIRALLEEFDPLFAAAAGN